VLRPGGRLALCDIVLGRPLDFAEIRRLRQPLSLLRRVFGDAHMEPLARYTELMGEHRFEIEATRDLTAATRPTFARWLENAERHREAVAAELGREGWQEFIDACQVLEGFWDDGTLGYALIAAGR
jgi:cyclopropane fatty-acyl-phospholipid synthase-like methyltransferase